MKFILIILSLLLAGTLSGAAPSPDISISYTADTLVVTWTPADTTEVECFVLYQFTHELNGVNVTNSLLEGTTYSIPYSSCSDNIFIVSTRCRTGAIVASAASKTYFTRLHADKYVQDLAVTHVDNILEASWSRPENSKACDINYRVNIRTSDGREYDVETTDTEHNLGKVELASCGKFVLTVTPFDNEYLGSSRTTTLIVDPGSAGGIENLNVNNDRIQWEEAQDNGECDVTYSVVVRDGDDGITTYTTSNTFFDIDWEQCSVNNIAVNSIIEGTTISTLYAIHRPRPEEVGKVDNVGLSFEGGILSASWSPLVIGLCEVNYKLQHLVDGILRESALILETEFTFRSEYCSENEVTVLASVDSVIGEETASAVTIENTEPPPVTPKAADYGNAIEVSWDTVAVGYCNIEYLIEHFVNNELIFSKTTYMKGVTLERIPCSNNEIRVTPLADGLKGPSTNAYISISVDAISAVEDIDVLNTNQGLLVSWAPIVKGLCEVTYTVSNFNGETTTEYLTDSTSYFVTRTDCVENKISVQGTELSTGITSEITTVTVDVDIELSLVRNLESTRHLDGVTVNWKPPVNSEQCTLTYIGHVIGSNNEIIQFETPETTYFLDGIDSIEGCSQYIVLLTPKSSTGTHGLDNGVENIWYLTEIDSVENLESTDYQLTWDRPQNFGLCEVTYNIGVSYVDEEIVTFESNITSQEINMIPCVPYEFSVTATDALTDLVSLPATLGGTGSPRILTGPTDTEHSLKLETLTVTWNAADAGACNLAYSVTQKIDSELVHERIVYGTTIDLETVSCTTNDIIVTPILPDYKVEGDNVNLQVLIDLDELAPVEEITVSKSTVTWNAPRYSGRCGLTYLVEIVDNDEIIKTIETQETTTEFNFVACFGYTVRVTPIFGDRRGDFTEKTFIAEEGAHKAPTHIQTVPSLASASVTLQANLVTENNCPINSVHIVCKADSTEEVVELTLPVEDNEVRVFEVTITPLVFNTHYSCVAKWLPHESEFSKPFYFYTMDVPIKDLEISDVTSNDITISWEEKEGLLRYVVLYQVVITSVEPNHFIQETCNPERGVTRFIEVPAGTFTFTFTEALPNYRYHISLITRYNIGLNSHAQAVVVDTLPDVPGKISDLIPQFYQEECAKYSAEGIFIWSPPCDINGDLYRFEVEITTFYEVNGESLTATQKHELLSSDASDDYTFAVNIPSVNPLFRYSVAVDIFATYPGEEPTKLTEVAPPTAYSACTL